MTLRQGSRPYAAPTTRDMALGELRGSVARLVDERGESLNGPRTSDRKRSEPSGPSVPKVCPGPLRVRTRARPGDGTYRGEGLMTLGDGCLRSGLDS